MGSSSGAMMRYFLDVEFNGFGGPLLSLALVPEDPTRLPSMRRCRKPDVWVAAHVLPVLRTQPISRPEMVVKLADYLSDDAEPVVISD